MSVAASHLAPEVMLTLFGGKGGVGKTTCAAAWAVARARAGARVLVLSIDPAHSLGDAFATRLPRNRATTVRRGLRALELNAERAVQRWLARRRPALSALLDRGTLLDREDVAQVLSMPVPGLDELAAFLAISDLAGCGDYDEIVVDTAPTGHALRLLDLAKVVGRFTELLQAMHEREAVVAAALGADVRANDLVEELRRDAARVERHLHDRARTRMLWVTIPEAVAVAEAVRTIAWLLDHDFPLTSVIANRLAEASSADSRSCAECRARWSHEWGMLAPLRAQVRTARPRLSMLEVPDYGREPTGLRMLATVGRQLAGQPPPRGTTTRSGPVRRSHLRPAVHRDSPALELADVRLLFFGGKGGVGKTTCATAAALAIARAFPTRRIQVLSTDPAASIGDALSMAVGDAWTPVPIAGQLEVRELDAAGRLADYRRRYEATVNAFFDRMRGGSAFDAAADRAVFSRLFELAPPGIDELVALVTVIDLMQDDPDGLLVVDTAPTGHALRLLSSQDELRRWVDLLMRIVLKYQLAARAESFARQLLELSHALRNLTDLLRDPARTRFVTVARAATLPRLETIRLMSGLRRLRIPTGTIIVNAGRAGTCPACRRAARDARHEVGELRRVCRAVSHRCDIIHAPLQLPPPRGVRELMRWSATWRRDGDE